MNNNYDLIPYLLVAEEIVFLLLDEDTTLQTSREKKAEWDRLQFAIGEKIFALKERKLKKRNAMYKVIAKEVQKQLPKEKRIHQSSLFQMMLFYQAKERMQLKT